MNLFRVSIVLFSVYFITGVVNGQGCSDAGFCTINTFKPEKNDSISENRNQLKVGLSYGRADHGIFVFGTHLEYNRKLSSRFGIDFKITTLLQNGNGIQTFGPGDIFVNGNYKISQKLGVTLGVKIPLTDANKTLDQLPLPMDYQSSLGTFDLILGLGFNPGNWYIVAAWQQPLTQNDNRFLSSDYPESSPLSSFQSTNNYIRSGDILLRVSYAFNIGEKFKITPGLLPIYHLSNDKFTDIDGIKKEIKGSQGLTLNATVYFDYYINEQNSFQLNFGAPLIVRESRPDGLTRHYIFTVEYRFMF